MAKTKQASVEAVTPAEVSVPLESVHFSDDIEMFSSARRRLWNNIIFPNTSAYYKPTLGVVEFARGNKTFLVPIGKVQRMAPKP